MSPSVQLALEEVTDRTNLMTGLTNSNDKNAAKEMFVKLHEAGEVVCPRDILIWALASEWQEPDAKDLAAIAEQVVQGKRLRITGGPYWVADIVDQFRACTTGEN